MTQSVDQLANAAASAASELLSRVPAGTESPCPWEGELRNMWKPAVCMEGIPAAVCKRAEVRHTE